MPVVCFASPKGGVGKTTLAANVGVALHRLGWRVLAIDFDCQNALRLHFEVPSEELPGIANNLEDARDWSDLVVETPSGVFLIPFGAVSAEGCMRVQMHAIQNPGWVRRQLEPFFEYPDLVVVADMPPGPSGYNAELDPLADLHIVVLLADAMSLALMPRLQSGDFLLDRGDNSRHRVGYVLNQINQRRQLCRDVLALSQDVLGDDLYGAVHHDEAVAEAVACQLTVLDYAPDSVASHDMAAVARRVDRGLKPA
ncbi:MAG: cellulose synthase operon protein YhjQ [Alphaproteobacteria bacterium]|nr:cellulose synthase operon protein YhjQ [Alphaproteobacteria bacterium]MBV9860837.1 cellulose synthase operon protein YhjQ [Alphaproteobacteria bacterium]